MKTLLYLFALALLGCANERVERPIEWEPPKVIVQPKLDSIQMADTTSGRPIEFIVKVTDWTDTVTLTVPVEEHEQLMPKE